MSSTVDSSPGEIFSKFSDHPRYVHEHTTGSEHYKIRPESEGNYRFSGILLTETVMDLPAGLARWWECKFVGVDLDIDREEMSTIPKHYVTHVRHTCFHLLGYRCVGFIFQQFNHLKVTLMVAIQIQNIFYQFLSIVKPEIKLDVVKCQSYPSALIL